MHLATSCMPTFSIPKIRPSDLLINGKDGFFNGKRWATGCSGNRRHVDQSVDESQLPINDEYGNGRFLSWNHETIKPK